jgi:hypothetical protein
MRWTDVARHVVTATGKRDHVVEVQVPPVGDRAPAKVTDHAVHVQDCGVVNRLNRRGERSGLSTGLVLAAQLTGTFGIRRTPPFAMGANLARVGLAPGLCLLVAPSCVRVVVPAVDLSVLRRDVRAVPVTRQIAFAVVAPAAVPSVERRIAALLGTLWPRRVTASGAAVVRLAEVLGVVLAVASSQVAGTL